MANPLGINIKLKLDDKDIKKNLESLKNTDVNIDIKNFTEINNNFKTIHDNIKKIKDLKNINPFKAVQLKELKEVVTLLKEVNTLNKGININVVSNTKGITSDMKGKLRSSEQAMKDFAKNIGLSYKEIKSTIEKALKDEGALEDIVNAKIFKEDKNYAKEHIGKQTKDILEQYEKARNYLKGQTFHVSPLDFDETQMKAIKDAFHGNGYPNIDTSITKNIFSTKGFDEIQEEFTSLYGHLIPDNRDIATVQDFGLALADIMSKARELRKGGVNIGVGLAPEEEAQRQARTWSDIVNEFEKMRDIINATKSVKDSLKNVSSVSVETEEIKEQNKELDKQNEKLEKKHNLVRASEKMKYTKPILDLVQDKYTFDEDGNKEYKSTITEWTAQSGKVHKLTQAINSETGQLESKEEVITENLKKQRQELEKIEAFKSKMQNNIDNLVYNGIVPMDRISELQNALGNINVKSTKGDFQDTENQYKNLLKLEKELQTEIKNREKLEDELYKDNDKLEAFKAKKINQIKKLYSNELVPKEEIEKLEESLGNLKIGFSKKDKQDIENLYDNLISKEKELKKIRGEDLIAKAQKSQRTKLDDMSINFKGFYNASEIEEFRKELANLSPTSETLTEDITKLNNKIKEFKNELTGRQKISKLGIDILGVNTGLDTKASEEDIKKLVSEIGGVNAEIKQIDSQPIIENGNEVRKVTYRVKEGNDKWHEYQLAIVQAGSTGETSLKKLDKGLKDVINREVSFTQRIKNAWMAVASFAGVTSVFYNIVHGFRNGINSVIELDTAMVGLKKVTDETEETYNNFATTANKMAIAVGHSTKSAIESTAEFAKLGYTLKDSAKLAQEALIYSNIGDIDIADATQSITATMKGFNLTADDTRHILDALNEVGNNYAISTGGIGDALQRSASALNEANNSFEESVGLITAGNASVQDVEKVGNSLFGGLVA